MAGEGLEAGPRVPSGLPRTTGHDSTGYVARGVLSSEADAEAVRLEVKRRLLPADRTSRDGGRMSGGFRRGCRHCLRAIRGWSRGGGPLRGYRGRRCYFDLPLGVGSPSRLRPRLSGRARAQAEGRAGPARARPRCGRPRVPYAHGAVAALGGGPKERPDDLESHRASGGNEAQLWPVRSPQLEDAAALWVELLGQEATARTGRPRRAMVLATVRLRLARSPSGPPPRALRRRDP